MSALNMVRKQFPQVKKVVDAKEGVRVTVQKRDSNEGSKKQPNDCALARACRREMKAEGAIINVAYSYVVQGEVATRYKTSVAVAREITSFDRHQDFAPGNDYLLSAISPSAKLGVKDHGDSSGPHNVSRPHKRVHNHKTSDIRVTSR